jgi:hypothetical protein
LWLPDGGRAKLDRAVITGWPIKTLYPEPPPPPTSDPTYDRQSRVFGDRGQTILAAQKVAVVGAGGAGSLIVEYLARLGVGELVIIDPDRVEETNLPRLAGARARDAHTWLTDPARPRWLQSLGHRYATAKVKVARRVARQANGRIRVHALQADVTQSATAANLVDCDYIFLAADSMQARLVVNALIHQYLVPGVQVGAKVQVGPGGIVTDVFSVVRPMAPGFGCLWCNELISPAKLQEEALTAEQLRQQRYVQDEEVHAPSVISLNAVAAAHAVDDYLHSVTSLLPTAYEPRWRRFHPLAPTAPHSVRCDIPRAGMECSECSEMGRLGQGHGTPLPTK